MSDVLAQDGDPSSSGAITDDHGPATAEQSIEPVVTDPEPGSVPLIKEQGNPKFPRTLMERGGYDMLRMSFNKELPAWVTSTHVLELNTSIEAVLLNITWFVLQTKDADIINMLRLYDWYPGGLLEIAQDKRTLRWDWIMAKDPKVSTEPGSVGPPQHAFWAKGYGVSRAKDEMLYKADIVKSLNFKSFRSILLQVSEACLTKSLGPVEVMGMIRRHWNDLSEPSLDNLRSKVKSKKKRLKAKTQAAKKLASKNSSSGPMSTTEPPVVSMDLAVDPSTATGPGTAGNDVVARVAEGVQPGGQSTVPGLTPPLPGVNTVRPPLLQAPLPLLGRQPAVGIPRGNPPVPARGGRGPQNYGRQRGGGRWGRKNTRSYTRGPRGGFANSGNLDVASNSQSRGGGRTDSGGFGAGPAVSWACCRYCQAAIPSMNQVCSYCYNRQY